MSCCNDTNLGYHRPAWATPILEPHRCGPCGGAQHAAGVAPLVDCMTRGDHVRRYAAGSFWDAFDFITDPWEKFLNGGPLGDFLNTPGGKIFGGAVTALAAVAEPSILAGVFSAAPLVGGQLAILFTNPLIEQALPGLVRGERVDRAFVESAKIIVNRIVANGGTPADFNDEMAKAVQTVTAALHDSGITPAALAAYNDGLRIAAGLRAATDNLPPEAQKQLDDHLAPLLAKLDPKALAAQAGVVPFIEIPGSRKSHIFL